VLAITGGSVSAYYRFPDAAAKNKADYAEGNICLFTSLV